MSNGWYKINNYLVVMKLHLLRHANAEALSSSENDIDRKLSLKGQKQCSELSLVRSMLPEQVNTWCSQAERTKQTLYNLGLSADAKIEFSLDLYLCTKSHLLQRIWLNDVPGDLLIVGHNFGISDLATYFLGDPIDLDTAEYVILEFQTELWEETSKGLATLFHRSRPQV